MLCPFDKSKSSILYKSTYQGKKLDLRCTSETHDKPTLYKCNTCKLIFSEHIESKFEETYTEVEDRKYIQQIPFKKKYFNLLFSKIKPYLLSNYSILEIGSYYGVLGNIIKPHVKSYTGLELSKHAVEYSKKEFNLNVVNEPLNSFLEKKLLFDVIIMSDVIEHLDNPFLSLKLIEKNLNPNGILIFTTFNMDAIVPKIMGKKYHWIMPMHKFYFTKSFFRKFMDNNGLELVETISDTHTTSLKYFFTKVSAILPFLGFVLSPLSKIEFFNKIHIKINLGDLDIYVVKLKNN